MFIVGGTVMPSKMSKQNAKIKFYDLWDHPESWPHDRPNYLFVARAFEQVGRALFGDQWNVSEPANEEPDPPDSSDEAGWEKYDEGSDRSDEAWEQAERTNNERRVQVAQKIAEGCESNKIKTARLKETGELSPIRSYSWNADYFWDLFCTCRVSGCWIFVEEESLDRFMTTQPHISSTVASYYSPYLKVMLFVCEKMKITAEHQPKKSEIEEEILAAWLGQDRLSQNLLSSMRP